MREFLGLKVSFWWHLTRIATGSYLIGKLVGLMTDNGWIQFALVMPLIWELTMVSGWLYVRANVKAHNASPDCMCGGEPIPPWNWRLLVSPGLYYDWMEATQPRYLLPPKTSHE